VTVAVDVSYASSNDHDPTIGISDGIYFVLIKAIDKNNTPHHISEGYSGAMLENVKQIVGSSTVTSQHYSSEIKIEIRSAEKWGSCHTKHDGGYTNVGNYQCLLDLCKGVNLEIYYNDANEQYRISKANN